MASLDAFAAVVDDFNHRFHGHAQLLGQGLEQVETARSVAGFHLQVGAPDLGIPGGATGRME